MHNSNDFEVELGNIFKGRISRSNQAMKKTPSSSKQYCSETNEPLWVWSIYLYSTG